MKRFYYCVYDKKAESFAPIFEQESDKGCVANVTREVMSGKGSIAQYPEDYKLYRVGVQDSETGEFIPELILLMDLTEVQYAKDAKQA